MKAGVALLPKEVAIRREAVAPAAAGFLVILLDGLGKREMDDGADGGFVDAEAERERTDHDADLVVHPFFLVLAARGGVQFAVIADGGDAVLLQEVDGFADAVNGPRIHDDVAFGSLADCAE